MEAEVLPSRTISLLSQVREHIDVEACGADRSSREPPERLPCGGFPQPEQTLTVVGLTYVVAAANVRAN